MISSWQKNRKRFKENEMNFDIAFDRLIKNEGGYTAGIGDPGGETKFGISKRSYPNIDIKNLTKDEAKEIYKRDFWDRGQMYMLDSNLAFQVFDFAVNSGIETAIRKLQKSAGVADDGNIGPITIAAVKNEKPAILMLLFLAERLNFMRKLSNWKISGAGWSARIVDDMRIAANDLKGL